MHFLPLQAGVQSIKMKSNSFITTANCCQLFAHKSFMKTLFKVFVAHQNKPWHHAIRTPPPSATKVPLWCTHKQARDFHKKSKIKISSQRCQDVTLHIFRRRQQRWGACVASAVGCHFDGHSPVLTSGLWEYQVEE